MICPFCDSQDLSVINSRNIKDQPYCLKRTRKCLSCHNKFTTFEKVSDTEENSIYLYKLNKK